MENRVILLNGPSSSGKSTLSRALQAQLREKTGKEYAILSIDDFMKLTTQETIYEDDVFEISGEMCEAALERLKTADGVIVDHVITSARIFRQFLEMLRAYPLLLVHVACPLEELKRRENARGDRHPHAGRQGNPVQADRRHFRPARGLLFEGGDARESRRAVRHHQARLAD